MAGIILVACAQPWNSPDDMTNISASASPARRVLIRLILGLLNRHGLNGIVAVIVVLRARCTSSGTTPPAQLGSLAAHNGALDNGKFISCHWRVRQSGGAAQHAAFISARVAHVAFLVDLACRRH